MSAEGKKKRGISGQTYAKANPFRINGWAPDWYARKLGATSIAGREHGGSTTARGVFGGMLAQAIGFPMTITEVAARKYNAAMDEAPVVERQAVSGARRKEAAQ